MADKKTRWSTSDFTGGINLALDPTKIKDNEFQKFENLIIYKLGSIGNANKRKGFTYYDTNYSSGTKILSLYEYITNAKTSNVQKIIAKTPTTLEIRNLSGTFSTLLSDDATKKCSFLTYRDNLYIFNRNSNSALLTNKIYDTSSVSDVGCPPCPQTFSVTAYGTGSNSSTFRYLVTYVYDDKEESYFIPWNQVGESTFYNTEYQSTYDNTGTYTSTGIGLNLGFKGITLSSNAGVLLSGIPIGGARVTARKIYRSRNGARTMYYLATINDNSTTSFMDYTADDELILEADLELLFKPYKSRYAVIHKERMFMANLEENQFADTPSVVAASITEQSATGTDFLSCTDSPDTRVAKYSYKFAYMYPSMLTKWTNVVGKPYSGFFGALSTKVDYTMGTANAQKKLSISGFTNTNSFSRKVAVFRTLCQFVNGITIGSSTVEVGYTDSNAQKDVFKVGDTVSIEDVTGVSGINRSVVITAVGAGTITFAKSTESGVWTSGTGIIKSTKYYLAGYTSTDGTTFVDSAIDSYISNQQSINFVQTTEDKKYPSLLKWSEIESPNTYRSTKEQSINQNDNDQIRAVAEGNQGIVIWKDKNMYYLFTTSSDESYWSLRKLYENIGCSDSGILNSFIKLPNEEYIWMYNNEFYMWQEGSKPRKCSEKIQSIIDGLTISTLDCTYDWKRNWVIYAYTGNNTGGLLICDLNFRDERGNGSWYHFKSNDTAGAEQIALLTPYTLKDGTLIFGYDGKNAIMKYGTNAYDTLWDSDTTDWVTTLINVKLQSKSFDSHRLDINKVLAKISVVSPSTETFSLFTYKDGSTSSDYNTTQTTTSTRFRMNVPFNRQDYKEMSFLIASDTNKDFSIREIALDINDRHPDI